MKKPKSTTKNGKTSKGNRRSKSKFPALNKGLNLSLRKDYIEPDYINGVVDENGDVVIRPCNEEEKAFLNQFYEESIITNFYHKKELKDLNKLKKTIIENEDVKCLYDEIDKLEDTEEPDKRRIKELKEIIRLTKKQNEETYSESLRDIEEQIQELREKMLLYPDTNDHKMFYNENNARNSCLFNRLKNGMKLAHMSMKEYDEFIESHLDTDGQEELIQYLEREQYEEHEERLKEVMEQEKLLRKKPKSSKR